MSNFGKTQLLKYGWTEGKGLGKDENGIAEALKPKLKFDTSGVGHKDSDFQWWSSIYDKALKNVVSDNNSEKVSINVIKENAFNISSTQSGLEVSDKKLSLHYGNFLKTSTLMDGSLIRDKTCTVVEEDKKEELSFTQISDEELFKACGGRTAHKGARHGLKLSGKLSRIAEQEKKLLASEFLKSYDDISSDDTKKSKKAKKRKKSMDVEDCTSQTTVENISDNEDGVIPPTPIEIPSDRKLSKRTVKKLKRKVSDLSHQLSKSSLLESDDPCTNSSKVKEQFLDKTSQNRAKKLRRKVNELSNRLSNSCLLEETATDDHGSNIYECENPSQKVSKKSKKKKHKRKLDEHNVSSDIGGIELDHDIVEPCTKKSRKQFMESTVFANFEDTKGISVQTETNEESSNSKYSYATWRNAKIKSKKLKKHDKKNKNKLESN